MAQASFTKSLDLTNVAGVPQMGATCLSTYSCMALMRISRLMPKGVLALLKQAMVGVTPWLNARDACLGSLLWIAALFSVFIGGRDNDDFHFMDDFSGVCRKSLGRD